MSKLLIVKGMAKQFLSFIFLSFFSVSCVVAQPDGAKIFKSNCASCHSTSSKKGTGPGLEDFWNRIPGGSDEEKGKWMVKWVKDPAGMKTSGDAYALKIISEYPTLMTAQAHLSDEEILAVAEYIKTKPHLAEVTASSNSAQENPFAPKPEEDNSMQIYVLIISAVVLLILTGTLKGIVKSLDTVVREKKGLGQEPERTAFDKMRLWILNHKLQTALVLLVLILIGSVKGFFALKEVAVYEGYAPEQPIKFSHKIHAGDNGISCLYCHHSAEKGKTAGIPSVNVCMNCHKGIEEGTWTKKEEISKIYAAAGWNPEEQRYDKPQQPIKWIRIHNLPDFTYFNHSQHVVVGKQECQTCHGPVEEMHLLKQHSPLTMGWCIDCHRKTNVDTKGNEYYEKMHAELIEKHKDKGITTFKVEDIGGTECGKCHY